MDVIHPRCAGIDCSKKDAKVCVRIHGQGQRAKSATMTTWGATTGQILALREHLVAAKVTCVVIESTSDYWKPFYYLLDDELDVILVNAATVRNLPGRKTDVSDAAWLADLGPTSLAKYKRIASRRGPHARHRRRRARHGDCRVEPTHQRRLLPRPRCRLLHRTPTRPSHHAGRQPTRNTRIPSHFGTTKSSWIATVTHRSPPMVTSFSCQ